MKIVITSPVAHDGKVLEVGDTADLPKAQAEALVDAGAALAAGRQKAPEPTAEELAAAAAAAAGRKTGA